MAEPQDEGRERKPANRLVILLVVLVGVLLPGGYLVVRNIGKVSTGPVPVSLRQADEKAALAGSAWRLRRKLRNSRLRLGRHEKAAGKLTADQSVLAAAAESSLTRVAGVVPVLDTVTDLKRKRWLLDSANVLYDSAGDAVRAFTRSLGRPDLEADSIDEDLQKVLDQ
jgi:hypothetical protein